MGYAATIPGNVYVVKELSVNENRSFNRAKLRQKLTGILDTENLHEF